MVIDLKQYDIAFTGLKTGKHHYSYQVDQSLVDHYGYEDNWTDAKVDVEADLEKLAMHMELLLRCKGSVLVPCDATGEEFRLPIEGQAKLLIKFGAEVMDDEQILVLGPMDHKFNIADLIYQTIVLSVPMKRYCPSYLQREDDESESDQDDDDNKEIDPRWLKLKDILTD